MTCFIERFLKKCEAEDEVKYQAAWAAQEKVVEPPPEEKPQYESCPKCGQIEGPPCGCSSVCSWCTKAKPGATKCPDPCCVPF